MLASDISKYLAYKDLAHERTRSGGSRHRMASPQSTGAGQRFIPDHEAPLQSRTGRVHRLVHGGTAPERIHKGDRRRVARCTRSARPISINVRITAVRKLAVEPADNGLLAPDLASGIARIRGVRTHGIRVGNWLSLQQAQALLNAPDIGTKKGLRDRAMFAVLLGCGLRRSEVAALTMKHIQMRECRWCIVDLVGNHGRVRTEQATKRSVLAQW